MLTPIHNKSSNNSTRGEGIKMATKAGGKKEGETVTQVEWANLTVEMHSLALTMAKCNE